MRKWPPVIVTIVVAIIFAVAGIKAMASQAAERPTEPPAGQVKTGEAADSIAQTVRVDIPALGSAQEPTQKTGTLEQEDPEPTEQPKKAYTYYEVPLDDRLQEYAQDLCEEYDFPRYDVVVAMIGHESSYREQVISETNDYGYMQINACNHDWLRDELGVTDMLDGQQNIRSGIYILQGLYHKYKDIGLALMAYNCGEYGASQLWDEGIYSTNYSRSILQEASELTRRGEG